MFRLIWRQRRRLLFTAFFGSLALMMMTSRMMGGFDQLGGAPPLLILTVSITWVIVAIGVAGLGALFVLVLPKWRQILELLALNLFSLSSLQLLAPALFDLPYVGGFIPFVLYMLLFTVIYGEALDRFRLGLDHTSCQSFTSPLDAQTLWAQLVPGEAAVDTHWDPLLHEITPVEDDPESFEAAYAHGASLYQLQTMTFLDRTAPTHARYYYVGQVNPKNRSLVEGTYEITITPRNDGTGCRVTLCSNATESLPRIALLEWFDDVLGDRADYIRAQQNQNRDWSMAGLYRRKVVQYI